jgi:hypothetical protein
MNLKFVDTNFFHFLPAKMTNTIFIDRVTNFFNEFKAIANNLFQASEELKNRTENLNTPVLNQKKNDCKFFE